ncbi:hypothetical protein D9M72_545230 [compost metagenome]
MYCRSFSEATPRLAPICCRPGNMMSIEMALVAISMAISAMNWNFVTPGRASSLVVLVICKKS